jgi:hypothetical protein
MKDRSLLPRPLFEITIWGISAAAIQARKRIESSLKVGNERSVKTGRKIKQELVLANFAHGRGPNNVGKVP